MHHPFRGPASYTTKRKPTPYTMPNVADELAALRKRGSVKGHAANLSSKGSGLSTPEAEAAAIKAKKANDKAGKNKAKEANTKGGSGIDQETEHAVNQTGKKKKEWQEKEETKKAMAKQAKEMAAKKGADAKAKSPKKGKKAAAAPAPAAAVAPQASAKAKEDKPKAEPAAAAAPVETVDDDDDTDDDDVPNLEEADEVPSLETAGNVTQQSSPSTDAANRQIANRNEKKARKMMARLGMRPVPHIARVTLKAAGGRGYFFLDAPDVYSATGGGSGSKGGDTYVIFGEAKQGGNGGFGGAQAQVQAAQQQAAVAAAQAQMAAAKGGKGIPEGNEEEEDVPALVDDGAAEGAGVDEEGVEAKDIDLVVSQASCSRAKAVAALKENDGDLVNAIMSLTT